MSWAGEAHGFSLVETLMAMAIVGAVFGATLSLLEIFQINDRRDQLRNETQDNARNAMDGLSRQLRNVVAPSAKYSGALEQAGPYTLTFQTVDTTREAGGANTANAMRVRYCLDDSNPTDEILWQQVARWQTAEAPPLPSSIACPDLNESDWESSTQVVQHITNMIGGQNRPMFVYGPSGTTEVAQIVSVETNLFIDLNPGQPPGESRLTSGVSLRNANRQPTAAFTATQQGAFHHVFLNASESRDADGLALTYKWWDNGTELHTTAQQYETGELEAGSKQSFKLTVTSPGGLEGSIEKEMTVK